MSEDKKREPETASAVNALVRPTGILGYADLKKLKNGQKVKCVDAMMFKSRIGCIYEIQEFYLKTNSIDLDMLIFRYLNEGDLYELA